MAEVALVWINCPSPAAADRIARALIERRLAAAANRLPEVASLYRWEGEIVAATETPLLVRTRPDLFDAVAETAGALHPHACPSIVTLPPAATTPAYAAWVAEVTREPGP